MSAPTDIAIVGFGAIGTVYGYILEKAGLARVTAVCRSNYTSIVEHGVHVQSKTFGNTPGWRPYRVVKDVKDAADREYAFVIATFKALPDVLPTPTILEPLLNKSKAFVLIQNGIGIEKQLQAALPPDATVITACAWIDCTVVDDYKVMKHGSLEKLVIGSHKVGEEHSRRLDQIVSLLRSGGGTPDPAAHIVAERWRKNLWNAAFSTLSTLSRSNLLEICCTAAWQDTGPVLRGIMNEVLTIARAAGLTEEVLPSSAIDATINLTLDLYGEGKGGPPYKPSMLVDLESGRCMEVEVIVGELVRTARELSVAAPRLESSYASLLLQQRRLIATRNKPRISYVQAEVGV